MDSNSTKHRRKYNRDLFDIVLFPIYQKIGDRIPESIAPNSITIIGSLIGISGSLIIVFLDTPTAFILAPLCYVCYHLFDTLDGYHARRTGKASVAGEFLDHSLDAIVVLSFYIAVIYRFELHHIFYVFLVAMRAYDSVLFQCTLRFTGNAINPALGPATEVWLFSLGYLLCLLLPDYQGSIVFYGCIIAFVAIAISITGSFNFIFQSISKSTK